MQSKCPFGNEGTGGGLLASTSAPSIILKKERGERLCATGYATSVNIHYCIDWNGSYSNGILFKCPERKRTIPPLTDSYIGESIFFSILFGNKKIYVSCAPL